MSDTKKARAAPVRHPSTLIPDAVVDEITIRVYLGQLEPPLTVAESEAWSYPWTDRKGIDHVDNHASRVKTALLYTSRTRDFLRVAVDMGLLARTWGEEG